MEIQNLLESIGLTKQEAKCYLALYRLKETKSGDLSRESKIATSNLYPVLNNLLEKGLISYKIINNIKIFMPSSVDTFSNLIEDKQKQLDVQKQEVQEAISKLKMPLESTDSFANYKFFSGISGIKSMWEEILKYMESKKEKSSLRVYSATKKGTEVLEAFYDEFHKKRTKLGHKYEIIMSSEYKERAKKRKKQGAKVKITDIKNDSTFAVFEDLFFVYHIVGKTPIGFLINDKIMANSFNQIFEKLWENI